jgi:tetratricopeptide (TPR) repeat protein
MPNPLTDGAAPRAIISDELFAEAILCCDPEFLPDRQDWDSTGLDELAIGLMAYEFRDYSVATSALMRVSDVDLPQFALAQEWLGITHLKAGHPELAIEPLRRALQLDEQLHRDPLSIAECQFSLGLAYARTGHEECALSEYRDALRCDPNWGSVLFEIARVHAHRNRVLDAVAFLAHAAQQDDFFLSRAQHDFDFDTVRQTPEFTRLIGDA